MDLVFISYLSYLLISVIGFYAIGFLILFFTGLLPESPYKIAFASILVGISVFVILVSIIKTGFHTVNIGFLLLTPFLYFQLRKEKVINDQNFQFPSVRKQLRVIFEISLAGFLIYSIRYWRSYGLHPSPELHDDFVFYAKLSYYLVKFGVETSNLEYIYPDFGSVSPYHYYEEWLNGGLFLLYKASPLILLALVTYSLGALLIWIGLCAIAEDYLSLTFGKKIICFLGLFITGIEFPGYRKYLFDSFSQINFNAFIYPKLFPVYVFIIAAVLLKKNKNLIAAATVFIFQTFATIVVAPAVFFASFLTVFYLFLKKRYKEAVLIAMVSLVAVSFLFVLYGGLSFGKGFTYSGSLTSLYSGINFREFLVDSAKFFLKNCIQVLAAYFWVILLMVLFTKVTRIVKTLSRDGILISALFFTGALLTWVIFFNMVNSWQFFIITAIPFLNILSFIIILKCLQEKKQNYPLVFGFVIIILLSMQYTFIWMSISYSQYDKDYLDKIFASVRNVNPLGAYIRSTNDYYNTYIKSSAIYTLGGYLVYQPENAGFHTVSLSVFDIPKSCDPKIQDLEQHQIENTSFYRFVQKQKQQGSFKNVVQSQADFVKKFKIDYIVVSKEGTLPQSLRRKVGKEIVDPLSGEKFYLLR